MADLREGTVHRGFAVVPVLEGRWWWCAWEGPQRVQGEADDGTNAICAAMHFLDPGF